MNKLKKYFWNILISIDQLANTLLGGDPDETISSRVGKLKKKRIWAALVSSILDRIDKDHTDKAIEEDEGDKGVVE